MNIDRGRIVHLLERANERELAATAQGELPDPVDIDSADDLSLMSKLRIDPSILAELAALRRSEEDF